MSLGWVEEGCPISQTWYQEFSPGKSESLTFSHQLPSSFAARRRWGISTTLSAPRLAPGLSRCIHLLNNRKIIEEMTQTTEMSSLRF